MIETVARYPQLIFFISHRYSIRWRKDNFWSDIYIFAKRRVIKWTRAPRTIADWIPSRVPPSRENCGRNTYSRSAKSVERDKMIPPEKGRWGSLIMRFHLRAKKKSGEWHWEEVSKAHARVIVRGWQVYPAFNAAHRTRRPRQNPHRDHRAHRVTRALFSLRVPQ